MSDAAPASPAKKATKPKAAKKAAKPSTHPPVKAMVTAAVKNLKDRKGSSLQAIKKYMAANYKCDVPKLAPFIRKCLVRGVADGIFVQAKGTGAAGSFKLHDKKADKAVAKPKKAKKPKSPKKAAAKPKKAKTPKKKAAAKPKKVKTPKKAAAKPKKAKTPAKKAAKPKAKKPAAKKAKK